MKAKALSGAFNAPLIFDTFRGNKIALLNLFQSSMLQLADYLVRSSEKVVRELGGIFYKEMYVEFAGRVERQDIVGQLVVHIGSGPTEEVELALRVFTEIAFSSAGGTSSLRPFLPFITSLLDNVQYFESKILRKLFLLLFSVGLDESGVDNLDGNISGGCDDVHIVIRKHLSLPHSSMKQIGIIGAVCFAVALSSKFSEESNDKSSGRESKGKCIEQVVKMLEMVHKTCFQSCESCRLIKLPSNKPMNTSQESPLSLFFDELCLAVQGRSLLLEVKEWILDAFSAELEEAFLGDLDENASGDDRIINEKDRSFVQDSFNNHRATKGELRFNIDQHDALVYLKFLTLHSSESASERETLIQHLCPLLRLLASCHDRRFGGQGLSEIDALLGCPLLLPLEDAVGVDFVFLTFEQQWTTAACAFSAVSWCRELINSFIYDSAFYSQNSAESQLPTQSHEELRTKVIEKLRALLELEDELKLVSSKCYHFSPPSMKPIKIPQELLTFMNEENNNENHTDRFNMTDEEKKSLASIVKSKAFSKIKSKQSGLKLKLKFEADLLSATQSALRPLDSYVCLALGFPELRVDHQPVPENKEPVTQKNSQLWSPLSFLLLSQLFFGLKSLDNEKTNPFHSNRTLNKKKQVKSCNESPNKDNPYILRLSGLQSITESDGHDEKGVFQFLQSCIAGEVFISIHERLASATGIKEDQPSHPTDDIEDDKEKVKCMSLIFQSIAVIVNSKELMTTNKGRFYLGKVLKQLAGGERIDDVSCNKTVSTDSLINSISNLFELLEEIVSFDDICDLKFIMQGIHVLDSIVKTSAKIAAVNTGRKSEQKEQSRIADVAVLKKKISILCLSILQRRWSKDTKFNKSNIGKLVAVFLEYSSGNTEKAGRFDVNEWGRISALSTIIDDVLLQLPSTPGCRGPVDVYPTCNYASFCHFFSSTLAVLPKELTSAFIYSDSVSNEEVRNILCIVSSLLDLLKKTFDLTKCNPSLTKRSFLLLQLKAGSRFMVSSIFINFFNKCVLFSCR
jgi:hypothetical protein